MSKREEVLKMARELFGQFMPPELEELLESMPEEDGTFQEKTDFKINALVTMCESIIEALQAEVEKRAHITNNIFERLEDLERWKIADIDSPNDYFAKVGHFVDDYGLLSVRFTVPERLGELVQQGTPIYIKMEH